MATEICVHDDFEEWGPDYAINWLLSHSDPKALTFLSNYAPRVELIIERRLGSVIPPEDRRDIVADAMLYVWNKRLCFGPNEPKATAVFIKRAVFDAATFAKKNLSYQRIHKEDSIDDIAEDPPDCRDEEAIMKTLEPVLAALERIPSKRAEVLKMKYLDDLSDACIAEVLGIKESSVRSLICRGIRDIKDILSKDALA